MGSSLFSAILLLLFAFCLSLPTLSPATELKGVDIEDPVLEVIPAPFSEHSAVPGSKVVIFCERARVSGISRLKLGSYASSLKITLSTSVAIPERLHSKIQVCFHRNNTLGLCQCEEDDWKNIQKGLWSSVMSPYDERYVDVKFIGKIPGSITITVEEDFQRWRLVCLALGFTLLLLAPIVSNWVPFYYTSSMVIGVFLVIIIILFQGMKLLPTGRKNVLYLTIYGSVLGAGSFLVHQFSLMVNSILLSFGLSEEMHNPVSIFLLVGIILAGAALGYWIVRKFVVSKDGTVDVGIAQFVKWAMRIIGTTSILQSTLDTPLAMGALVSYWIISKLITSLKWHLKSHQSDAGSGSPCLPKGKQVKGRQSHPKFLSRSSPQEKNWNSRRSLSAWSDSPVTGVMSPSSRAPNQQEYYSTFHKVQNRKKFTRKEWDDFTHESTRQAIAEWAASPEVPNWLIEHADRIQLLPSESSDETGGSEPDSIDENVVGSTDRPQKINPPIRLWTQRKNPPKPQTFHFLSNSPQSSAGHHSKMFLQRQRAAVLTQALQVQLRRYAQSSVAALLHPDPELDRDLESTTSFPIPDPKYAETIFAVPRTTSGKSISAKERKAGRVPSIIFEQEDGQHGGNKRLISVRTNQIRKLVGHLGRSFFLSRLFDLEVRSDFDSENDVVERVRVLPRSIHLHSATDAPLNVTFIRAPSHALLKVEIPLVFRGDDVSPGLKKNGCLNTIKRTVKFLCPADVIPPYIDVDLSELDVNQKIVMGDLKVHPDLKLLQSKDEPVCKITGARVSEQKKSKDKDSK
ncbi:hypothetical protein ACFX2A_008552 [Malus domestica]